VFQVALLKATANGNQCPECSKVFTSVEYLESHMSRRHAAHHDHELAEANRRLDADVRALREELRVLKEERVTARFVLLFRYLAHGLRM
jgi:hypothetical protein